MPACAVMIAGAGEERHRVKSYQLYTHTGKKHSNSSQHSLANRQNRNFPGSVRRMLNYQTVVHNNYPYLVTPTDTPFTSEMSFPLLRPSPTQPTGFLDLIPLLHFFFLEHTIDLLHQQLCSASVYLIID